MSIISIPENDDRYPWHSKWNTFYNGCALPTKEMSFCIQKLSTKPQLQFLAQGCSVPNCSKPWDEARIELLDGACSSVHMKQETEAGHNDIQFCAKYDDEDNEEEEQLSESLFGGYE